MRAAAAAAVAAAVGIFLVYRHTLDYGFHYDDYHFIRPYSLGEIRAAFHGPWDPSGIELPFFRPLTIAFYAARFELFGLDSRAHHAVSLVMFGVAAVLLAAFVWGSSRRAAAAALAPVVFVTHPSMPYALVAWVTNQMHLLETIVVLLGLVWWSFVRRRTLTWWLPLLPLGGAAFLIKEDAVMLLPSIVALHGLRRRSVEPTLGPVPRAFIVLAAMTIGLVLLARAEALRGLAAYALPTVASAWRNFWHGLDGVVRLVPPDRPWQQAASWFATLLPVAGLVSWKRSAPELRFLMASGALVAVAFNLPFVFVTKNEQMHLVATGAVLMLTGSAACVLSALPRRAWRAAAAVALAAGAGSFAAVARDISTDFEPFGPIVLARDAWVRDWAAVPEELRQYLRSKLEAGAKDRLPSNPASAIDVVAFGLHPSERSPDGTVYRWMAHSRIELHVTPSARRMEIPLRHEIGAFRDSTRVDVDADGRLVDALVLEDDAWHVARVALRADARAFFRRSHRVRVTIPRAWRPSDVIPGSGDRRTLGLQVGEIRLR